MCERLPTSHLKMTPAESALYLACLVFGQIALAATQKTSSSAHQDRGVLSADVGESVTLRCVTEDNGATVYYWYKQILGREPTLISSFFRFNKNTTFHGEYRNSRRISLEAEKGRNHLTLSDVQISDAATYFCVSRFLLTYTFGEGATLIVRGSGLDVGATVHQPASESVQPGGSVNLDCTVHSRTCHEDHSIYWFRGSSESRPGLIYTHSGQDHRCQNDPGALTHTCVYNLQMERLNRSHAGTFYCAVASCGRIQFGNGTELKFEYGENLLVYILSGALAVSTTLVVFLTYSACKLKRNNCQCSASEAKPPGASTSESHTDAENLHYAALSQVSRPRRVRDNTSTVCVYSRVK